MKKFKVGLMTMSDGRIYLHNLQRNMNMQYQNEIAQRLVSTGLVEVIQYDEPINSNTQAREAALMMKENGVEMTIFNYAIWCYPQYTAVAANFAPGPYLLFCNIHPSECGMVGMMAASGTLDQLEKVHERVWGSIGENEVLDRVMSYIKSACSINRLRGTTYGNFGGRPMGMYTTVASLSQWQKMFGIDVEDIEQYEIMKYGNQVEQEKVTRARQWLEDKVGNIAYNDSNFTPEKLETQIRSYYALRKIIDDRGLDFIGIKAHGDLTDWYVTMDLAEAFLNDPYDWDGPHDPIVAATESDMDGALTMQILKNITGMPVLFADVRHYEKSVDCWFFGNSGTHATYYAGASMDPEINLKNVSLLPESKDYPAGGGSVHHFAAPGKVTMARLARKGEEYYLTIVPGEIVQFDQDKMKELGNMATPAWPIAFTKIQATAAEFLEKYPCNHIHGVYGDYVRELEMVAKILGIKVQVLDGRK
ncbi:L-fucose/L-arabinose isomerase family protein [Blautia schinkii]|nr:L-fucose/L-arabinose isomerase family protein [Blautia schinkii]